MRDFYHSALSPEIPGQSLKRFKVSNGVGFVHDVMSSSHLPKAYAECDLLYAEPPWRNGLKTFSERCCIDESPTYDAFMGHVVELITTADLPAVLILGKQAGKYLEGWTAAPVRLQRFDSVAYYRKTKPIQALTANGILEGLAKRFNCVGDFFAGYGSSARAFSLAGKRFVASDCNPRCIFHLKQGLPRGVHT